MTFVLIQFLTGLSGAASLFLVAAGLTVIFGVTRIVNFAHGSLFMLGAYIGWSILSRLPRDPGWFIAGVALSALATGGIGVLLETSLLRRLYRAPELFQLLATFGVVLIIQDLVPLVWGPNDLPLPRPPWLRAFVSIAGERFPRYDLVLIALGPIVLGLLWLLLHRTRFGVLIRAATEDRDMAAALGIDQRRLFTAVFALGAALAGLAGALALPNASANTQMDLSVIVEAFVVVVLGGLGSVTGAFLASLLIGLVQSFGIALIPQATLVLVFLLMAGVLAVRPNGLLGQPLAAVRGAAGVPTLIRPPARWGSLLLAIAVGLAIAAPLVLDRYGISVLTEALIAVLFAAGLHLMMGPGGMPSFGHAAWFGIGAYAVGLAAWLPLPVALLVAVAVTTLVALAVGWFVVRLSGVYMAMLTLAFAQIVWAVATQWGVVTGGDDGILGVRSALPLYPVVLAVAAGGVWLLRRALYAPFGYALRAARDSAPRAAAIGLHLTPLRLGGFVLAASAAGLAGGLFAYAKGSVFPTYVSIGHSVDALLMVLLGGVQTVSGPVIGGLVYTGLYDWLLQAIPMWRLVLGAAIIALVLLFPAGLAGVRWGRLGWPANGWGANRRDANGRNAGRENASPSPGGRGVGGGSVSAGDLPTAPPRTALRPGEGESYPSYAPPSASQLLSATPLIASHLRKSYDGVLAVADMSFTIAAGEILALIGPNGAGKSTCFALLNGQVRADAGQVRLHGTDTTGWPAHRIARLGVGRGFQVTATFASMTVAENVQMALIARDPAWWCSLRSAHRRHRPEALARLALVGLADQADTGCAALAYGDLKRLELAIALACDPALLLMDEPTAGMGSSDRMALMALVRDLARQRRCAVLFTEHDMDIVFAIADRIMVMDRGALIAEGDAAAVRASPLVQHAYLGTA